MRSLQDIHLMNHTLYLYRDNEVGIIHRLEKQKPQALIQSCNYLFILLLIVSFQQKLKKSCSVRLLTTFLLKTSPPHVCNCDLWTAHKHSKITTSIYRGESLRFCHNQGILLGWGTMSVKDWHLGGLGSSPPRKNVLILCPLRLNFRPILTL